MELTPTLILNLALLIVPPVAIVLGFRQWLARHIRWVVAFSSNRTRSEETITGFFFHHPHAYQIKGCRKPK